MLTLEGLVGILSLVLGAFSLEKTLVFCHRQR